MSQNSSQAQSSYLYFSEDAQVSADQDPKTNRTGLRPVVPQMPPRDSQLLVAALSAAVQANSAEHPKPIAQQQQQQRQQQQQQTKPSAVACREPPQRKPTRSHRIVALSRDVHHVLLHALRARLVNSELLRCGWEASQA
ncbi:unnamed protein product [Polarella glacialis]|uniref:Uncharacterized protein n=1 Tax=Polarella glacialis TaxID=89957 RepID=A0A813GA21_POLGL|nr:unnamed protein product [Polarella glacialis]